MTIWQRGAEKRRAIYQSGLDAEQRAVEYLQARGLELVARNYRAPCGEIDIIMQDDTTLVFIEVRYRSRETFCRTTETIDAGKQRRLRAAAEHYLQQNTAAINGDCRFDIVTLTGPADNISCHWLCNAF